MDMVDSDWRPPPHAEAEHIDVINLFRSQLNVVVLHDAHMDSYSQSISYHQMSEVFSVQTDMNITKKGHILRGGREKVEEIGCFVLCSTILYHTSESVSFRLV